MAEEVARGAERRRKEWQAAAREGDTSGQWSSSRSADEDLRARRVETGIAGKIRSRDTALMSVVLTIAYPGLVFSAVASPFPTPVKALVGLATVAVVLYAMTEPSVSLVVFGVWSLLAPLVLSFVGTPLLSAIGLFVLVACWVPFALAVLLALAMPD